MEIARMYSDNVARVSSMNLPVERLFIFKNGVLL